MTYKVIKPFNITIKGDVFTNEEDPEVFKMSRTNKTNNGVFTCEMTMDKDDIDELVEDGYLIEVNDKPCTNCDKLAKISGKINEMVDTYTKSYDNLSAEYEKGNVQPCVKVEAETVYFNVIKTLNIIKGILDE